MKRSTTKLRSKLDPEQAQFAADVLESIRQAKRGTHVAMHTPETILARRRGRPVGSNKADTKVAIKLRLDPDIVAALRATGDGWQTRVNEALRVSLHLAGQL